MSLREFPKATFSTKYRHVFDGFVTAVAGSRILNNIQETGPALNGNRTVVETTAYQFLPNRNRHAYRSLRVCRRRGVITPEIVTAFLTAFHSASRT